MKAAAILIGALAFALLSGCDHLKCATAGSDCCGDGQCGGGLVCLKDICQPKDPISDVGNLCNETDDCQSGFCVSTSPTDNRCTKPCEKNSDCPTRWTCASEFHVCSCAATVEICDGLDNDCDGEIDNDPADRTCSDLAGALNLCLNGGCSCLGSFCGPYCVDMNIDAQNCGTCGNGCPTDAAGVGVCSAATCTHQRELGQYALLFELAVDSENIYWVEDTNDDACSLMKTPIGGGESVTLANDLTPISFLLESNFALVLDASNVYWSDHEKGVVMSIPKAGGQAVTLSTKENPTGLAVDAERVYWVSTPNLKAPMTPVSTLLSMPLTGGPHTTLATGLPNTSDLRVDGRRLYWFSQSSEPKSGEIGSMPTTGGSPLTIVSGLPQGVFTRLAIDDTSIYWTEGGLPTTPDAPGRVMKAPKSGGAPTVIATETFGPTGEVLVHKGDVYWGNIILPVGLTWTVLKKLPKGTTTPIELAGGVTQFTVDATGLYYISRSSHDGSVWRLIPR